MKTQKTMLKYFLILLALIFIFPATTLAAQISFHTDKTSFSQKESFLVDVWLDTQKAPVNAVEGSIIYPSQIFELKEVRDGNSIINFWVERPHQDGANKISFSGITTGGFTGEKKLLFSFVLEGKVPGQSKLDWSNLQILKNDGLGTKLAATGLPLTLTVTNKVASTVTDLSINDTNPPEDFNAYLATDASVYDGQHFLVFSTTDKGTGVDHFLVRESPWYTWGLGGKYNTAISPYLLHDQTLKSKITIKAIDKAQNERVVKIGAQNPLALFLELLIPVILLIACAIILNKKLRKFLG